MYLNDIRFFFFTDKLGSIATLFRLTSFDLAIYIYIYIYIYILTHDPLDETKRSRVVGERPTNLYVYNIYIYIYGSCYSQTPYILIDQARQTITKIKPVWTSALRAVKLCFNKRCMII